MLLRATVSAGSENVHAVDAGPRERDRARDGDAARARADVENRIHARRIDPGCETPFDELGERRARHEHAPVDVELQTHEPHPLHEVGSGQALANPPLEESLDLPAAGGAHRIRIGRRRVRVIQIERVEHQRGRFVERIVRAVSVRKARLRKAPRAFLHEIADRQGRSCRGRGGRPLAYGLLMGLLAGRLVALHADTVINGWRDRCAIIAAP